VIRWIGDRLAGAYGGLCAIDCLCGTIDMVAEAILVGGKGEARCENERPDAIVIGAIASPIVVISMDQNGSLRKAESRRLRRQQSRTKIEPIAIYYA
jgi:hypothetical protein